MSEPEQSPQSTESSTQHLAKVDAVRQFVLMMKENELTALDFIDGSLKIRLRRGGQEVGPTTFAYPPASQFAPPAPTHPPAPVAAPTTHNPTPPAPAAPAAPAGVVIESPMVGTFYSSSSPDAPSFVSVGSNVRPDTTVCIIEAMKVFTDIPAGVSGTVTEVLVKNGQPVEFGQPLYRINPA